MRTKLQSRPKNSPSPVSLRRWFLSAIAFLLLPAALVAFPPAPYHTIYGMVRDENGNALRVNGAEVVLYRNDTVFLRQPIQEMFEFDRNYQIRLRMDSSVRGPPATRTWPIWRDRSDS